MNEIYPITFDFNQANQKGLITDNKLNKRFFEIQKAYKISFEKYINEILNLKKYDDLIKNSDLKFGVCPDEKKDYYQNTSTLNLDYIYIKNNLHIEKLSIEDLNEIEKNFDNFEKITEIVKKTYKDVITFEYLNNKKYDKKFKTQFFKGFNTDKTIFSNYSLILIIREGSSNNELNDIEFKRNLIQKYDFINNIITNMNEDFKNKLECQIEIAHLLR